MGDGESSPLTALGYDPGGRGSQGAAVVSKQPEGSKTVKVATMSSVAEILISFTDQCVTRDLPRG
jgi:hypothetical protein